MAECSEAGQTFGLQVLCYTSGYPLADVGNYPLQVILKKDLSHFAVLYTAAFLGTYLCGQLLIDSEKIFSSMIADTKIFWKLFHNFALWDSLEKEKKEERMEKEEKL